MSHLNGRSPSCTVLNGRGEGQEQNAKVSWEARSSCPATLNRCKLYLMCFFRSVLCANLCPHKWQMCLLYLSLCFPELDEPSGCSECGFWWELRRWLDDSDFGALPWSWFRRKVTSCFRLLCELPVGDLFEDIAKSCGFSCLYFFKAKSSRVTRKILSVFMLFFCPSCMRNIAGSGMTRFGTDQEEVEPM